MNPMAFFKERGFSGTRSNTSARFSGEPSSLSYCVLRAVRCVLKAAVRLKDLTPSPLSLSREEVSKGRAVRVSKFGGS